MQRAHIFLAELLDGLVQLRIRDAEVAKEVLRMLSLDRLEPGTATTRKGAWNPEVAKTKDERSSQPSPPPDIPAEPAPFLTESRDVTLRPVKRRASRSDPPKWLLEVAAVARPAGATPPPAPPAPLFPRMQTRAVLTAALATFDADGPLDIPRVVEMLAELQPIRTLPLELTTTTRRGVQVLVDTGVGMGPYRADADQLLPAIESIVTDDQISVYFFSGCPVRGAVARGADEMKPWQAPPRGTPVFALTDLGIGAPPGTEPRATVEEWLSFVDQVAAAGSTVTALVPYGPRRWPRRLAREMPIIHWDRRTTAAIVRRGVGSHRVVR
jgi:hypothetical protein